MGVKMVQVASCDHCELGIVTSAKWVNASVYGAAFHESCWEEIGGPRVARLLYMDDIHYYVGDVRGDMAMQPYTQRQAS